MMARLFAIAGAPRVASLLACALAACSAHGATESGSGGAPDAAPAMPAMQAASAGSGGSRLGPPPADAGASGSQPNATRADAGSGAEPPTAPPSAADAGSTGLTDAGDLDMLGASRCDTAGVALCDDFEQSGGGNAPDPSLWRVITSYSGQPSMQNRIGIDDLHVARGAHALHVHTETNDPVYIETQTLPATNDTFFGRVLAYFEADPGAMTAGHWGAFVGVGKKDAQGQDIEVRIGGQFDILVANYSPTDALQISSSRDGFYDDGVKLPVGTWTCFEFEFDGADDELRVWMDGDEIERLHVTDWNQFGHGLVSDWSPQYDRLRIGYQSWNADTPIDVWYDAAAVDTQRIGCSR